MNNVGIKSLYTNIPVIKCLNLLKLRLTKAKKYLITSYYTWDNINVPINLLCTISSPITIFVKSDPFKNILPENYFYFIYIEVFQLLYPYNIVFTRS